MINFKQTTNAAVIAHVVPWHGTPGHAAFNYQLSNGKVVPYESASIAICDDQIQTLAAAGIVGINVDYYGPDHCTAPAAARLLEACARAGLSYSLCIDQGALHGLTGDAATQEYIRIMRFVGEAFFNCSSYLYDTGRAVVNFFGEPLDATGKPTTNWTAVRASVSQKLALVFENNGGFTHPESDGAFGWVMPMADPTDINLPYLQSFVATAAANPTKLAFYAVYPGFDDSLASWGKKRIMTRGLGKTLRSTLAQVPTNAKYALVATDCDLEEGTNIMEKASFAG